MDSHSSGSVLAMLHDYNGTYIDDKTQQYILLLFFKITLNTLILSFWKQNLKSLLGIFSIVLYVADLLLISSIIWAWQFTHNHGAQERICLSLSHSSTIYSMLPPLVLLGGAVDYALGQKEDYVKKSLARTAVHLLVVMVMWTMTCVYSYYYTHSELMIIKYQEGLDAIVCPVKASTFISHFTSKLLIVIVVILMFKLKKLPYWFQLIKNHPWYMGTCSQNTRSDLSFIWKPDKLEEGLEGTKQHHMIDQQGPALFISLTICFALSWTPYMVVSVICDLLPFAVPSYASVNLLWAACANSLLAGITFWYNSKKNGPLIHLPDVFCPWSIYWYMSKESINESSIKLYHGPTVLDM